MGKIKLLKALSDEMFVQIANKNAGLTRRELAKKLDSLGYGTSRTPITKIKHHLVLNKIQEELIHILLVLIKKI